MPFPDYDVATETASGTLDPTRLDRQIRLSAISAPGLALFDGLVSADGTSVTTLFTSTPTSGDQAVVTAVVAAHDGTLVEQTGTDSITFRHSEDHSLTASLSVPVWDDIDNQDVNGHSYLHPNGSTQEVLVYNAGLYRISYSAAARTGSSYALVKASVYRPAIINGFDAEVAVRSGGTDIAQITASQIVSLSAGDSVSPYFSTDGPDADLIGDTISWSIERVR